MNEPHGGKQLKVTFCSGAGSVTGANFLLEGEGKKFLIDCGLEQGTKLADDTNWEPFAYDPKTIDILFITHAHIDHVGRIPKLFHDGFRGRIISTKATKDLALPMLMDTVNILGRDSNLKDFYNEKAILEILGHWEGFDYHQKINIDHGFQMHYKDAGHILGSGMLEILYNGKRIIFTGDLGNSPSPLLRDTESIEGAHYLIMESVYGDRNHESRNERKKMLEHVIEDNYNRKGSLIIPTFSLERSQELLYEMNSLVEGKRIPVMPVFLDSPLAIRLTTVYHQYRDLFNDEAKALIKGGDDIFMFPGLKPTLETEDSKLILKSSDPKIILAGSGMSNGGRIIHHEKNYLPNKNNTILLIGYQSMGTLGRAIEEGAKKVHIFGEEVAVNARLEKISGYSGHKDSDHLVDFVEQAANSLEKVFVVMGEPKSSLFLAQRLRDNLGIHAVVPTKNESVVLDC